jgi:choline dehydrogenase-like flavoprotein
MSSEIQSDSYDAVVIGTGIGGSVFAYGLARRGLNVAVVERGDYLRPKSVDLAPVHNHNFEGQPVIGGQTKSFGAAMYRLRESDFRANEMEAGISPAWPIAYDELEPYYGEAERLFRVHGSSAGDATEPHRSTPWPHAPIPHQGPVQELVERVVRRAATPVSYIPRGIDYDPENGGKCVLCRRCDAYYCPREAKMDAEIAALRPAIQTGKVTVLTNTSCLKVLSSLDGRKVSGVLLKRGSEEFTIRTGIVGVGCGLRDTPLLLWRSRTDRHPNGLGNASGALGRHWASHTQGWVFPISLGIQSRNFHQKTFAINAYYESGPNHPAPMGVIQAAGNIEPIGMSRRYRYFAELLLNHSFQTFVMTEALPTLQSGFTLGDDGAKVLGNPVRNTRTFGKLRALATEMFRAAGYRVFSPSLEGNFHNVGTARMGSDPASSVIDGNCRAHDVEGLYVIDSSALPTSGALNSGLTIAAVSLRAAAAVPLNL